MNYLFLHDNMLQMKRLFQSIINQLDKAYRRAEMNSNLLTKLIALHFLNPKLLLISKLIYYHRIMPSLQVRLKQTMNIMPPIIPCPMLISTLSRDLTILISKWPTSDKTVPTNFWTDRTMKSQVSLPGPMIISLKSSKIHL